MDLGRLRKEFFICSALTAGITRPSVSYWARLKVGRFYSSQFAIRRQTMGKIIGWMTACNHGRVDSTLGYVGPIQFAKRWREVHLLKAA